MLAVICPSSASQAVSRSGNARTNCRTAFVLPDASTSEPERPDHTTAAGGRKLTADDAHAHYYAYSDETYAGSTAVVCFSGPRSPRTFAIMAGAAILNTDKTWHRFGVVDPYYGVLTSVEYRSDHLTDEAREKFFRSGQKHVERVLTSLRQLDPDFAPNRVLDFGCGVGRVTLPLGSACAAAHGVDVSPGMLAEAHKNARECGVDNVTFDSVAVGNFDLVHCFNVLQHIPPRRGFRIVADLASRVEPNGMIVLHIPYYRVAPAWRKLVTSIKRSVPIVNRLFNLVGGLPFSYPTMTMFCYDIRRTLAILRAAGIRDIRMTVEEPYRGYQNMMIYGHRTLA